MFDTRPKGQIGRQCITQSAGKQLLDDGKHQETKSEDERRRLGFEIGGGADKLKWSEGSYGCCLVSVTPC